MAKIIQISAVTETSYVGETPFPCENATIYGLGDDGLPYVWIKAGDKWEWAPVNL